MSDSKLDTFVPVSRELVLSGILPWAGLRYEDAVQRLLKKHPLDERIMLASEALLEVYRLHGPANERMTAEEADRLGLVAAFSTGGSSFLAKLRHALGNPD